MEDDGGTPMFPSLGKHCNLEECRRLDFLPFKCDACNRYFCADHRHYEDHACDAAAAIVVIGICDICKKGIRRKAGQADHVTLAQHQQSEECVRPYNDKKKKERCPVPRCKNLLTFTNSVVCKRCRVKTCLSHRFPEDHACNCASASVSASVRPPPVLPRPRVR